MSKYIYITIIILSISGCMSLMELNKKPQKQYTKKEYEIIRKKAKFIAQTKHILEHKLNKKSLINFIKLPTLEQPVMFVIPIEDVFDNVFYIEQIEKEKLHLNNILIQNQEYFYDSVNGEILLILKLPYAYLLDESVKMTIDIVGSMRHKTATKSIVFNFLYKPMKKATAFNAKNNNPSFKYTTFESKDLSEDIAVVLKKELKHIDIKRLSKTYKKKVLKIKNEQ